MTLTDSTGILQVFTSGVKGIHTSGDMYFRSGAEAEELLLVQWWCWSNHDDCGGGVVVPAGKTSKKDQEWGRRGRLWSRCGWRDTQGQKPAAVKHTQTEWERRDENSPWEERAPTSHGIIHRGRYHLPTAFKLPSARAYSSSWTSTKDQQHKKGLFRVQLPTRTGALITNCQLDTTTTLIVLLIVLIYCYYL